MHHVKHPHLPMPQIINIMRLFIPLRYSEEFHADADNELIHIINGSVKLCFESGEVYTAGKNETLFIPRGVRHKDIFEEKTGLEVFHINFKWSAAEKFFAAGSPDCLHTLSSKDKNEILLLFDMFRLDNYRSQENLTMGETRLAHLLGIAWRHVFRKNAPVALNDTYARLASFAYDYMMGHLSGDLSIDRVAAYLKVSRATLIRAFHHASGMSFNACLRSIRMNEAYFLLKERGLNTCDCALRCGYGDPAYFSRVFKKHFGFSPKNIR